jgi:curved DNA-binding protein CbpA
MKGQTTDFSSYPNPYRNLGVSAKATNSEIKAAYNSKRALANNNQKKVINNAYSTLSNAGRRAKYNADASEFYRTHRPTPANIMKMMSQGSAQNQQTAAAWQRLGF